MTDAPCPACSAVIPVGEVFATGACPDCGTPLGELHAIAAGGGVE